LIMALPYPPRCPLFAQCWHLQLRADEDAAQTHATEPVPIGKRADCQPRASAKLPQWHGIVVLVSTGLVIAISGRRAAKRSSGLKLGLFWTGAHISSNKEPQNCCFLGAALGKNGRFPWQTCPARCYFAVFNSEISGGRVNREGGDELFEPDAWAVASEGARQLPTGTEAW
jgi:hypothetical protein